MWRCVLFSLTLFLAACGGGGGGGGGPLSLVFTSPVDTYVREGRSGIVYTARVTGPGPVSFSIVGGPDAALFTIDGNGGLAIITAPNFEAPTDVDRNNTYLVTIQASNGAATATLAITVFVEDVAGPNRARRVAAGFSQPLFLTGAGDNARVFVLEKGGLVRLLTTATGAIAATPFLDLTGQINTSGERGLLGFALAPDFATSRNFYVYFVNTATDIEVRRYRTLAADPNRADTASADTILRFAHPGTTHLGGWIGFGADGFLYLAVGDGGTGGAPAPDVNSLLGKILRIDPRTDSFPSDANRDYAIPAGNPFAGGGGAPEVFARGLRNPFRAGFDRQTGHLYIGDVGQNTREEIDLIRANTPADVGLNFGWPAFEGTLGSGSTAGLTGPVLEYTHGTGTQQGNSVTGGYVYRGPLANMRGEYFFGDFVSGRVWSWAATNLVQGGTPVTNFILRSTPEFAPVVGAINNISSFGEDDVGNLYIVDFDGEIFVLDELDGP